MPEKGGTVALLSDVTGTIRKDYSRGMLGTSSWDNGFGRLISVTGQTIVYPNGKIEQIFRLMNFRPMWFLDNSKSGVRDNIQIPLQLWTAMPNNITDVNAQFSCSTSNTLPFSDEAYEWWRPSWAFEKQNNMRDRLYLYTVRHTGNQDETVDLWVKVEGY